jgi:hypothetical protein
MNNFGAQGWFLVVLSAVLGLAIAGCGGKTTEDVSVSHLGLIANSYNQFRTRNRGQAPQSEAELRDFVVASNLLTDNKIGSFDELLTSDRDFQPITLLFGKDLIQAEGRTIIGYETQGKDGKRLVAYEGGFVEGLDETEFSRLVPTR